MNLCNSEDFIPISLYSPKNIADGFEGLLEIILVNNLKIVLHTAAASYRIENIKTCVYEILQEAIFHYLKTMLQKMIFIEKEITIESLFVSNHDALYLKNLLNEGSQISIDEQAKLREFYIRKYVSQCNDGTLLERDLANLKSLLLAQNQILKNGNTHWIFPPTSHLFQYQIMSGCFM
eukprot:TRINITY_DN18889_c0_g1_i1.p1 TRINITY_DN18889_c0_g1~~TRINITY_DN18889_c0_g1_i1.p1  ORF type:complete len:178 (-),score=3.47 TRINITY_DN18889_c0_g1_i1:64-597(-)